MNCLNCVFLRNSSAEAGAGALRASFSASARTSRQDTGSAGMGPGLQVPERMALDTLWRKDFMKDLMKEFMKAMKMDRNERK